MFLSHSSLVMAVCIFSYVHPGLNISLEINNFSPAILKIIKLFPTYFPGVSGIHFRGGLGDEILIFENVEICTVLLEKQSNAICKDLLLSVPTGDKKNREITQGPKLKCR